jgi:hypothetical protein
MPRLPDERVGFVTTHNTGGVPSLQLFRKVLERRAPETLPEIERLVAPSRLAGAPSPGLSKVIDLGLLLIVRTDKMVTTGRPVR